MITTRKWLMTTRVLERYGGVIPDHLVEACAAYAIGRASEQGEKLEMVSKDFSRHDKGMFLTITFSTERLEETHATNEPR